MNRSLVLAALFAPALASAIPMQLTHQGRLLDSTGVALTGDQDVSFALYDAAGATDAVWSETQTVSFDSGYFAVSLGADANNLLDVDALAVDALWIGIAVGTDPELDRLPVESVPYALLAHSVIGGKVEAESLSIGGTTISGDGTITVADSTVIGADGAISVAGNTVIGADGQIDASALGNASDTLDALDCSGVVGDAVAIWDGSAWTCGASNAHLHDAADIASGTLDIGRIPVGREAGKVMPGDATFSAADVGALPDSTTAADLGAVVAEDSCAGTDDLGNFRLSADGVEFCDGELWQMLSYAEDGSQRSPYLGSCKYVHENFPNLGDGTYWLDVDGNGSLPATRAECDMTTDGGGWTRFWWYEPNTDLVAPIDMLGQAWGECASDEAACRGRIPGTQAEDETELLAKDSASTVYKWQFDSGIRSAHAAWQAFANHAQSAAGANANAGTWNPTAVSGAFHGTAQDSFMYRTQNNITSFLLDDDNCDCLSTLSAGHGMCGGGFSANYGTTNMIGVDVLNDGGCGPTHGPKKSGGLELYFR